MYHRICQHCERPFQAKRPQAKYCGQFCRSQAAIERREQRIADARIAKQETAPDGGMRHCHICDKWFRPKRKDQRICSKNCKQKLWNFTNGKTKKMTMYLPSRESVDSEGKPVNCHGNKFVYRGDDI